MPRSEPHPPSAAAPSPAAVAARLVAERWAESVKAQAIYPAGHHRVARGIGQLSEALLAARGAGAGTAGVLRIVFADGGVHVDGTAHAVEQDGPLAWLRERLDHVALAGIDVLPDADGPSFERFGRRLLDLYAMRDPVRDAEAQWTGIGSGLRLLNRRFEGVFDGAVADAKRPQRTWAGLGRPLDPRTRARLVESLRDDPQIRRRLESIRQRLASTGGDQAGAGGVELLSRLASMLPARAAENETRLRAVTGGLLDALELQVESNASAESLGAFFDDPALERRVAFLCTALFKREDGPRDAAHVAAQAAKDASRPQGHAGDERVNDDLAAFVYELEALPPPAEPLSSPSLIESEGEQLAVLLHVLLNDSRPESLPGLDAALRKALTRAGPAAHPILKQVLDATGLRADAEATSAGSMASQGMGMRRVVDALRRVGSLALLRRSGHLVPERVVDAFPTDFALWIDALDLGVASDRAELVDVIRRIGPHRVRAARGALGGPEGLLTPPRVAALLEVAHVALAPVARVLFEHGGGEARPAILAWLRRLGLTSREASALQLLDDQQLPEAYLAVLFDLLEGRPPGTSAEALVVGLLSRFVRQAAERPELDDLRIQALQRLAEFDLPEVEALLRHVAFARRWFVVPVESRAMRGAAREALVRRGAA